TGEGWASYDIGPGSLIDNNILNLDNTGGPATLDAVVAGNASTLRSIKVKLNGSIIADTLVNGFTIKRFHITNIPLSSFTGGNGNIEFVNGGSGADKIVVAGYVLTYPRLFNFGAQSQFSFDMPAGPSKYIEITNFNF